MIARLTKELKAEIIEAIEFIESIEGCLTVNHQPTFSFTSTYRALQHLCISDCLFEAQKKLIISNLVLDKITKTGYCVEVETKNKKERSTKCL